MQRLRTRREILAAMGVGAAGLAVGCGRASEASTAVVSASETATAAPTSTPLPTSTPTAVPTPTPRPAGAESRLLMAGTRWETPAIIHSTGMQGPALMVLGGIHGNEPGGWMAAEEIAAWNPTRGVIAVVPRANELAIRGFLRLVEGEGDLNRQYPGDAASDLPTSRLAAEITDLARELEPALLLDLHESWAFYIDREAAGFTSRQQAGTAFLGQTITGGVGPLGTGIATQLAELVNPLLAHQREHLIARDGTDFRRDDGAPSQSNRGRSSLSLGGHVPGLTPVLVEMGQQGQSIERRAEMHTYVVRAAMDILDI